MKIKNLMKPSLSFLLTTTLVFTGIPLDNIKNLNLNSILDWKSNIESFAAYDPGILSPGYWGTNITASVSGNTLYLSGTGEMKDQYNFSKLTLLGDIDTVIIGEGITVVGMYSFYQSNITSVSLPSTLLKIKAYAFEGNKLSSINLPEGLIEIGSSAFWGNNISGNLIIPNSVTLLGYNVFLDNQLTSVIIGTGLTYIESGAFALNQLTSVTIPNSVTRLGYQAFAYNQLTSITLPTSLTTIEGQVFHSNQLTSIEFPNSVTTIGDSAFVNNQLTSVEIPESITRIEAQTFYGNRLTSIVIPDSVTEIGGSAFYQNKLTSITIPNSVNSLGNFQFSANPISTITVGDNKNYIIELGDYGTRLNSLYNINGKQAGTYTLVKPVTTWYEDTKVIQDVESYYDLDTYKVRIPVRFINEYLDAKVYWNEASKKVTIDRITTSGRKVRIEMVEGSTTMKVNGTDYTVTTKLKREEGDRLTLYGPDIIRPYDDVWYTERPDRNGDPNIIEAHFYRTTIPDAITLAPINPPPLSEFPTPEGEELYPETDATLTTKVEPIIGGTVTGAGTYTIGNTAWVTAIPSEDYVFTGWKETGETQPITSVVMNTDKTLTATFAHITTFPYVETVMEPEIEELKGYFTGKFYITEPKQVVINYPETTKEGFLRWDIIDIESGNRELLSTNYNTQIDITNKSKKVIAVFQILAKPTITFKTNIPSAVTTNWDYSINATENQDIALTFLDTEILDPTKYKFTRWEEKNLNTGVTTVISNEKISSYKVKDYNAEIWLIMEEIPVVEPPEEPPIIVPPPPNNPTSNLPEITVELPTTGTHYQVSNDGIKWSEWYMKPSNTTNIQIETQPGEGLKKVFYRTGDLRYKKIPMYDGTSITMVDSQEKVVDNLYETLTATKTIDMTSPIIKVKTSDNNFITTNGVKTLYIDVTDNLDKQPIVIIEVFETDSKGKRLSESKLKTGGTMSLNKTQLKVDIPELQPKIVNGKVLPYHIRIEAFDSKGNSTVETVLIYSKP